MLSLLLLDHQSWWTTLGLTIKFGSILIVVALGVVLIAYSNPVFYFTTYWLFFVFTPQIVLWQVDTQTRNICMEFGRIIPCNVWPFLWLTIAMIEIVFIWVPILGFAARTVRKNSESQSNPTVDPTRARTARAGHRER